MTKDLLFSWLNDFVSKGYLEHYHSDEKISIFRFLKTSYVGFSHDMIKSENVNIPKGALLTKTEAEVIIRSKSTDAISFLCTKDECNIVFSDETFALCNSAKGRFKLKKKYKKFGYFSNNEKKTTDLGFESFPEHIGTIAIKYIFDLKRNLLESYRKNLKKVKIFACIALACIFVVGLIIATGNLRDRFNGYKESVVFDKNADEDEYSHVKLDMLVPFAELSVSDIDDYNDYYHGTYYLYYYSKDDSYGILKFEGFDEKDLILTDDQEMLVFEEPIILYGSTYDMPSEVRKLSNRNQTSSNGSIVLPGNTVSIPGYGEFDIPEHSIPLSVETPATSTNDTLISDKSDSAIDFLHKHGISIDFISDLGDKYIIATVKPETVISPINKFFGVLWVNFLVLAIISFIPLFVFGFKADVAIEILQRESYANRLIEEIMTMEVNNNNIHQTSD